MDALGNRFYFTGPFLTFRALVAVVATVAAVSYFVAPAQAGLMGSTYDVKVTGHVLASGNKSTEQYSATNVLWDFLDHNVPNSASPTPTPPFTSSASRVNRVSATAVGEVANPPSGLNLELWIKGPANNPNNIFVNSLDPSELVEVELSLVFNNLAFGDKIVLNDVNLVKGILYDAVSVETTGTGFAGNAMHPASPLHVLAKYNPADVNQGLGTFMKVQFDYSSMQIPEPTAVVLLGLGIVGLMGFLRRRQ